MSFSIAVAGKGGTGKTTLATLIIRYLKKNNLVPILAIDTPTALDLTSGEPSDPNVHADLTVTFHRPKEGLLTRTGRVLAGRVLVAPIGIPVEADHD